MDANTDIYPIFLCKNELSDIVLFKTVNLDGEIVQIFYLYVFNIPTSIGSEKSKKRLINDYHSHKKFITCVFMNCTKISLIRIDRFFYFFSKL